MDYYDRICTLLRAMSAHTACLRAAKLSCRPKINKHHDHVRTADDAFYANTTSIWSQVPGSPLNSRRSLYCVEQLAESLMYVVPGSGSHKHSPFPFFFFLFFSHTSTFQLQDKPWSRMSSLSPPSVLAFNIYRAHRVQQSHSSSLFRRVLLTHALALSASQFVHKKKSPRAYTSTHSGGFELTKLTDTRLEDNLIRHRGERLFRTR